LLSSAKESGFIAIPEIVSHGPMYDHGFSTLFLAETYGMSPAEGLRGTLSQAVRLIVDTQNDDGGWRYQPQKLDADISVTICQIMALRAARNAGIYVPAETVDRCLAYVKSCQNPDGGFRYMQDPGPSEFPRSAGGLVALYSAGIYQGPEVESALSYLAPFRPTPGETVDYSYYFYGHYYAAQAMWLAGGDRWTTWYPAIRNQLIERQSADGSWPDSYSAEYGTSMACLILQIPNDSLPILQR
jgi:hypothetical protein